jgi:hypothetical protein
LDFGVGRRLIIGASGSSGTLIFHGRPYPLSSGGVSAGLVFGGSQTWLHSYVSDIRGPSDVAGVYGAAGAGAALVYGARAIVLRNEKGAVLTVRPASWVDRKCRPEWAGDLATIGAATLGFARSSQIEAAKKLDNAQRDSEGYLRTDHPRCAIAENPCISSIGNGNTIIDVRSPAMSNSVLR